MEKNIKKVLLMSKVLTITVSFLFAYPLHAMKGTGPFESPLRKGMMRLEEIPSRIAVTLQKSAYKEFVEQNQSTMVMYILSVLNLKENASKQRVENALACAQLAYFAGFKELTPELTYKEALKALKKLFKVAKYQVQDEYSEENKENEQFEEELSGIFSALEDQLTSEEEIAPESVSDEDDKPRSLVQALFLEETDDESTEHEDPAHVVAGCSSQEKDEKEVTATSNSPIHQINKAAGREHEITDTPDTGKQIDIAKADLTLAKQEEVNYRDEVKPLRATVKNTRQSFMRVGIVSCVVLVASYILYNSFKDASNGEIAY